MRSTSSGSPANSSWTCCRGPSTERCDDMTIVLGSPTVGRRYADEHPDEHADEHADQSPGRPRDEARDARQGAVRAGTRGSVHSWELVTAVDGPGTRLTYFLSGCALRCQYCQNPDTWRLPDGLPTPLR